MNKYGVGICYAHHGEILQGIFDINDNLLSKGLITLPCNIFYTKAVFYPNLKSRELKIVPQFKTKTLKTIKSLLVNLKIKIGGTIILKSNIIEKIGLGSSTCDIVASIRSIADFLGIKLSPELIAYYTVLNEKASDPLMFNNQNLLFAQRKGVVLRHFNRKS